MAAAVKDGHSRAPSTLRRADQSHWTFDSLSSAMRSTTILTTIRVVHWNPPKSRILICKGNRPCADRRVHAADALAQELGQAGRNYQTGLRAYEDRMRELAAMARSIGPTTMATLIPRTGIQVRLMAELLRLLTRMPPRFQQRLSSCRQHPPEPLDSIHLARSTVKE